MRTLKQISDDMRELSGLLSSCADDLDAIRNLFGTPTEVKAQATPKGAHLNLRRSNPNKGVKATEQQKLLIRQLWFSLPPSQQTTEKKREICKRANLDTCTGATVIRQTPKKDLSNFLKTQGQPLSGARSI